MAQHCQLKIVLSWCHSLQNIKQRSTTSNINFYTKPSSTLVIRKEELIYSLVRINKNYEDVNPEDQQIGSFVGFQ